MSVPSDKQVHSVFHGLFDMVVVLKGLNGVIECVTGTALLINPGIVLQSVQWLTQSELLQDPRDLLATSLQHWANNFERDAQILAGFYLLAHGVVKFALALLLFKERPWVFPLALFLFTALVAFALYKLFQHWSWALAAFVAFDLFTIGVIAKEWSAVGKVKLRVPY